MTINSLRFCYNTKHVTKRKENNGLEIFKFNSKYFTAKKSNKQKKTHSKMIPQNKLLKRSKI